MASEKYTEARRLASKLAHELGAMTAVEREGMAAGMPTVCNPDGHFLTLHNTLFLVSQSGRTDLTMVAGFRQWIDHGRCVRKGEHSLGFISVPMRVNGDGQDENGERKKELRFRLVPVFDVSQTDDLVKE